MCKQKPETRTEFIVRRWRYGRQDEPSYVDDADAATRAAEAAKASGEWDRVTITERVIDEWEYEV